jgi:hypothetical protein
MQLQYDEDFVESAVLLCAAGQGPQPAGLQVARYHRERERLYSLLDPDDRNTAFFKLNLEWFREWGLEERLVRLVGEYPLLRDKLALLIFRKARRKQDEGAELYVNSAACRNGVLALNVQRFTEAPARMTAFVRHELLHLHDMVNPEFGYLPELSVEVRLPQQQRLALERYRLLWALVIDGRLSGEGKVPLLDGAQRWIEFDQAFAFWAEPKRRQMFESLWNDPFPSHPVLSAIVSDPRELQSASAPGPGAPCPLCGFPTFNWAPPTALEKAATAIKVEFHGWSMAQGACGRCCQIFNLAQPTALV